MAEEHQDFESWLVEEGARQRSLPLLVDAFCRHLNARGFAVRRCNLANEAFHPLMTSTRYVWFDEAVDPGPINPDVVVFRRQYELGGALIDEVHFNAGSQDSPQYRASPFYRIEQDGELCARILPEGEEQPFPVFEDLSKIGCTGYFGLKLHSFPGMLQKIGLSTSKEGGFSDEDAANLKRWIRLMTLHIDTIIEHEARYTLARVYVGADPGEKVCKGMIRAGDMIMTEAAIWFSDLRGFTSLSERMAPEEMLAGLNDYFEAIVPLIYDAGGEVLKYVGDAILAIFPVEALGGREEACKAALATAHQSIHALEELNEGRSGAEFQHGVGLHVGEVNYGNIGSRQRLDFTVIGSSVNLTSRIESTCKEAGRAILCSEEFATHSNDELEAVGDFAFKGVGKRKTLYSPVSAS